MSDHFDSLTFTANHLLIAIQDRYHMQMTNFRRFPVEFGNFNWVSDLDVIASDPTKSLRNLRLIFATIMTFTVCNYSQRFRRLFHHDVTNEDLHCEFSVHFSVTIKVELLLELEQ